MGPETVAKGLSKQTVVLVVVIVVLVGGALWAYRHFGWSGLAESPVVISEEVSPKGGGLTVSASSPEAQEILAAIEIITRLKPLDTKLFEDERFRALQSTPFEIPLLRPSVRFRFESLGAKKSPK